MAPLPLDTSQKEILEQEVRAFLPKIFDAEVRARYTALLQEVERGELSPQGLKTLEGLLEVLLESGRARSLHGPMGESALASLFQKTSKGLALTQTATEVNQALKGLQGQTLRSMAFRPLGPGSWVCTLQTDRCELTLRIGREGLRLSSLGVDLG